MHDLVIRGGTVVDGTGAPARTADVAIDGEVVVEVGRVGAARREVDADGLLVLPGWVDIHTHYDGQAVWDPELAPSSTNGVTTALFGNCSVGFAPVRRGSEDYLITLMEGVEDIPGSVLSEGLDFSWSSFPEYLDVLESRPRTVDVGAQVPHGAIRFFVMGERGTDHAERPTSDEIAEMGRLVVEGLEAGAFGFTTSRTTKHRAADGRYTPSLSAADDELVGIARAMGDAGLGVLQANSDFGTPHEWELLRRLAEVSGRPLSFSLIQRDDRPGGWREQLDAVAAANQAGVRIRGQVASRPIGILLGFDASIHPFAGHRAWRDLGLLPHDERIARLRRPEVRQAILDEEPTGGLAGWMSSVLERTFELGDPPDYEPPPHRSIAARATSQGCSPWELALDLLLEDDGRALLYHPFENYSDGDLDVVREMLASPWTVAGLSDGGAHVATICDATFPTTLLTHWVRDRSRGERLSLEHVVERQARATAQAVGLLDRGVLAPGYRADVNVVDLDRLQLEPPAMARDLPAGGRRLVQRAIGYRHTLVAGTETFVDGRWTGETPGRLVRGPQARPG